jgi:primary-amine oxidase
MVVPYGDPSASWVWRAAFDEGEYGLGQLSNTLERGLDVPEHAMLLDTVLADDTGADATRKDSVAIYERDGGLLWKHHDDYSSQKTEGRRARELVIGQVVTVGNYDYGISWVFTQDGQIKVEAELTGILLAKGVKTPTCERCRELAASTGGTIDPTGEDRYGTLVAPNIVAPNHQHFFNFRLDLDVDGPKNCVSEMNVRADDASPNAFLMEETVLANEAEAQRDLQSSSHRRWKVFNRNTPTELGHLPGYVLEPGENTVPYLKPDAPVRLKAQFINHHFWATKYHAREVHGAGDYPNQSPGGAGLPRYVGDNENLVNEDVVVWYTFGLTHIASPEEWPVMPTSRAGFRLVPKGFFTRNPALDVPGVTTKKE